jgi:TupA-like ATPgrasp
MGVLEMRIDRLKSRAKIAYRSVVGPRLYEKLEFWRHVGYWPNLDNPRTFNERVCARKFRPLAQAPILADKLAAREFVRSRVGDEVLTRLYYAGDRPDRIDFAALPSRFVLKGAHGSGPELRAFVWDKSALSQKELCDLGWRMLRRRCGPEVNEWWYSEIPSRLMVEEMLLEGGAIPPDYKFYVFAGQALYVQVIGGRHGRTPHSRFYDSDWRAQPFMRESHGEASDFERPSNLSEMVSVAEALGTGSEFVRVDLYSVGRRVVFGELTLAPGAGWVPFRPANYDFVLGGHWPGEKET